MHADGHASVSPVIGRGTVRFKPQTSTHFRRLAADHGRSGPAATIVAVTGELLDAFSGVDFGGVDIDPAVEADLVQPVEIAGHAAGAPEPAELLERIAVEDVDGLVGVV